MQQIWRSFISEVIYKYLECGDPHFGFARVKCEERNHDYNWSVTHGYYSNKSRGMRKEASLDDSVPCLIDTDINSKEFRKSLKPFNSESLQQRPADLSQVQREDESDYPD